MAVEILHTEDSSLLVEVSNLGVRRGERWIIRHVNLEIRRGELVYIIGANGSGKSTFAKSVIGLIKTSEGTVKHAKSLRMGYVPQRLVVSPTLPLTLRRIMTLTRRFPKDKIDEALEAVGLDRLGNPPVTTLSGGEFQRLLLARALIHRPNLLILDEPNQGVDTAGSEVHHKLIEQIRKEFNCGVLMISHDLELVLSSGDDVVVFVPHKHDDPLVIEKFSGMEI